MQRTLEMKEWTIMFYFASDNPLAPGVVSQLKAIKEAGFHPQANVVAQFDPHTIGTPTHVFDVNLVEKLKTPGQANVGFRGNDPFVRNLVFDKLWGKDDKGVRKLIQDNFAVRHPGGNGFKYDPPKPDRKMSGEQNPKAALCRFLDFCRTKYPARHYMLFILGHGLVVGNDVFLFDDHVPDEPVHVRTSGNNGRSAAHTQNGHGPCARNDKIPPRHSLMLKDMGDVLRTFKKNLGHDQSFELLGLHSCCMSGMEIAYEIQGTANYMLASQSPAFVGSWPYRQILLRVFKDIEAQSREADEEDAPASLVPQHNRRRVPVSTLEAKPEPSVKKALKKIFYYCIYNSYDFQLAGYSFDLCLCDLTKLRDADKGITNPLKKLSTALIEGLSNPLALSLILLAHWDAQSFWQEQYTDLYDFCFRLHFRCGMQYEVSGSTAKILSKIRDACEEIMDVLESGTGENDNRLIVRSEFVGPDYQYSHGLSVYFPWSMPPDGFFSEQYEQYEFKVTSWAKFLKEYFRRTTRETREIEEKNIKAISPRRLGLQQTLLNMIDCVAGKVFNGHGQLSRGSSGDSLGQRGSMDPTGDDCDCRTIKNYPPFVRTHRELPGAPKERFPMGRTVAEKVARQLE